MEPRSDSKLTDLWLEGGAPEFSCEAEVARELMATDYIYKTTLYPDVIEDYLRLVASKLKRQHPKLTWTQTWQIVRFYGPISLKIMCLKSACTCIPQRLPDFQ